MPTNKALLSLSLLVLGLTPMAWADEPLYKDAKQPVEARVNDLIKRMTLEEKLNQLRCDGSLWQKTITTSGYGETLDILRPLTSLDAAKRAMEVQALSKQSRLGIPMVIHDEALHGLIGNGTTSFPQAIGLAATWDPDMANRVSMAIAEECRARGVRHVLSPVINVIRDARWGRVEETYGEDPLLTSKIGVSYVKGFEMNGVATTPKHYVDNAGDGGRDSNAIEISERSLREVYFPPFEAVIKEGGASTIMSSYNSVNGRAASANEWLLTEVLRKEWGFKGWVASDYGATSGIMEMHHNTATPEETAAAAINAGMDSEWPGVYIFGQGLDDAVKHGLISQANLDQAVKRVLRIKFKTGVFDTPFADPDHVLQIVQSPEHRKVALDAAREALTLLKNEGGVLPLKKDIGSIALIGPDAKGPMPLGDYSGTNVPTVSVYDGLKVVCPGAKIEWASGSSYEAGKAMPAIPASEFTDLKGEYFDNPDLKGSPKVVRSDKQISFNWSANSPDPQIPQGAFSVRWTGTLSIGTGQTHTLTVTSDDGVRLWINDKLVIDDWTAHARKTNSIQIQPTDLLNKFHIQGNSGIREHIPFKLEYYQGGGDASCDMGMGVEGERSPDIAQAVELAKRSDVAVIVTGIIEGEAEDRAHLDLPGNQEELINAVAATGKPVVVVLLAGSPVTMEKWLDKVPAVLDAWYPGQEGGTAIAEELFGDVNPSGKLPMTFPRNIGQVPLYYNPEPTGRGYDYVDLTGKPQFAFGFGLSYTTFEYRNLRIVPDDPDKHDYIQVSFDIQNTGSREGTEVVQLYLHQEVASVVRPLMELKNFTRVRLAPGGIVRITLGITPDQLALWDARMKRVIEPGKFDVMVGSASDDIRLRGVFTEK